jgi:hypothetical protein
MILKAIKKLLKPKLTEKEITRIEAPVAECGPGHLTQGYGFVGIPAPVILPDDPWFGPSPIKSKKQMTHEEMLEYDVLKEDVHTIQETKEPDNIHEVMYDMATRCGKTTTQLDPVGGSENFQGGSENIHG